MSPRRTRVNIIVGGWQMIASFVPQTSHRLALRMGHDSIGTIGILGPMMPLGVVRLPPRVMSWCTLLVSHIANPMLAFHPTGLRMCDYMERAAHRRFVETAAAFG